MNVRILNGDGLIVEAAARRSGYADSSKMIKLKFPSLVLKLGLLAVLTGSLAAQAQPYFTDKESATADVVASFRKTGSYALQYEMVVYLGDITNFLTVPVGTTINITNYTTLQLSNLCSKNFGNLQWSVFAASEAAIDPAAFTNTLGVFPANTSWYTVPRGNPSVQTAVPSRLFIGAAESLTPAIANVSDGALAISASLPASTTNSAYVLAEPVNSDVDGGDGTLDDNLNDANNPPLGDFGGQAFTTTVENTTPSTFSTAVVSDFYQNCTADEVDPLTGLSTEAASYHVGYFTLNPNGSLTFTRSAPNPVVTGGTASVTSGFSPLLETLSVAAYGSITNYVWNFGNGVIITNTSPTATAYYTKNGSYTARVTVYGPGGSSTQILGTIKPASPITATVSGASIVLSGSNGPVGTQYHFLTSTNLLLPLSSWKPVGTNLVTSGGSFGYTSSKTNSRAFFILVSP